MREEGIDPRDTRQNIHIPTGMTRTGNRPINTLIGGEETGNAPGGSGDWLRDLLFGGGGGGDGGSVGGDGATDEDAFRDEWERLLAELEKPLDMNDPLVQNILTGARTATLSDLAGRGIHGGYSEANAQQAYINAASQLQGQKRDAYLRALGAAGDYEQRGKAARLEQDRYLSENDPSRGIGALVGGGLGTLAGGLGGFFLGGGPASPLTSIPAAFQGASIGSGFGSQVGSGIGGMFAPRPRMRGWSGPSRRTAGGY